MKKLLLEASPYGPNRSRLAALLLASLAVAFPAAAELPVGLSVDLTLTHDAVVRSYDVLRPASSVGGGLQPLVVDLHGFTSSGDQ